MTPPETRDSRGAIVKLIVGILILALSISAVAVTADDYAKEWNRMSAEHDRLMATPAGQSYERQLVNVHNTFWRAICAMQSQCEKGRRCILPRHRCDRPAGHREPVLADAE